ncbi:hypothetical protein Acr_07g0012070 [Actinidia rufa]|uniref:Uncharacterized protein n=1 Tax=Actinidia rufa TaxID=165716 RepID=A0A7J0EX06_9ERIC|nr:hypothetical protein Acr_07g0012070 [Actinidia rufa]
MTLLNKVRFLERDASDRDGFKNVLEEKNLKLEADLSKYSLTFKKYEASASTVKEVCLNQKQAVDTRGIGYEAKLTKSEQPHYIHTDNALDEDCDLDSEDSGNAEKNNNEMKDEAVMQMDKGEDEVGGNLEPSARVKLNHPLDQCTTHVSEIDEMVAHFMHAIASNLPVHLGRLMFNLILKALLDNSSRAFLPFRFLIIEFLKTHMIEPEPHETHLPMGNPISQKTLRLSNADLGTAHPPSQLRPHAVEIVP